MLSTGEATSSSATPHALFSYAALYLMIKSSMGPLLAQASKASKQLSGRGDEANHGQPGEFGSHGASSALNGKHSALESEPTATHNHDGKSQIQTRKDETWFHGRHHARPSSSSTTTTKSIFHPRPRHEIYMKQCQVSMTLQAHTLRLCDLMSRYHATMATSVHGETRKIKRRARKQVGELRGQIKQAAEQEKDIFMRLSDLFLEARSREMLDFSPLHPSWAPGLDSGVQGGSNVDAAQEGPRSNLGLNGATAAFIPQRGLSLDRQTDSAVSIPTGTDDEHSEMEDGSTVSHGAESSGYRLAAGYVMTTGGGTGPEVRPRARRLSEDDAEVILGSRRRRLSLPDMVCAWPP
ncbi:uncharacterized protein UV8b_01023 [Ustilaginoidea virens]|uniref:Uncharacterized protein n=1 Tax=Ustilaginoidea virens TaxID=1159556 RepID=A0A8E5HK64_USTVR|nr:uncharacterized protein UV8b_01023 [Ustilaginoidea virens]QUC16782.1 hypothetical protein UV8b_01023 [Ustilaginoidea virens]